MIKGAPATAEATAIPGASATTEIQNYPASDSDPSGASDVVLLCQITGSDPASLDHWCEPTFLRSKLARVLYVLKNKTQLKKISAYFNTNADNRGSTS